MARANRVQVSFYLDVDVQNNFQMAYPRLMSDYLRKCINLALKNRQFFNDVFFDNLKDKFDNNVIVSNNLASHNDSDDVIRL